VLARLRLVRAYRPYLFLSALFVFFSHCSTLKPYSEFQLNIDPTSIAATSETVAHAATTESYDDQASAVKFGAKEVMNIFKSLGVKDRDLFVQFSRQ
jgi:hypothetical protein